jgi:hypothetical protein
MARSKASRQEYIPGMCNIGPSERRRRRLVGVTATVATLLILVVLILSDAPTLWRLVLIFPATIAASGFLQDALRFCAAFGLRGIYNVINSAGVVDSIELEEFRLKDKRKAQLIVTLSGLIGLSVALLSLLIPHFSSII